MGNYSLFPLLLWLPWSFFMLGGGDSQTLTLLQLKKHLEYPKQLDIWYDRTTLFCSLPPSPYVTVSCEFNSVTELKIMGELPDFTRLTHLQVLDLSGNRFDSHLPTIPKGLLMVSLERNSFTGEIPTQYTHLTQLQHIDISFIFNKLSGTPPAPLFSLPNISFLNLASNVLSGPLGYNLTCGTNLGFVDISNNRLTGSLASCLNSKLGNKVVNFDGNCLSIDEHNHNQHPESYCRDETHKNQSNPNSKRLGVSVNLIVGIAVSTLLLAIAFVIVSRRYCHRRISEQHLLHKSVQENFTTGFSSEVLTNARYISENAKLEAQGLPPCRSFTLEELKEATNNFDNSAFLGEGSYGKLFKGRLESGIQVAIRYLPTTRKYWIRNLKLRLDMLAKIRHPHLVCILGHCIEVKQDDCSVHRVFLVYEYIPNGNFRSHLSESCVGEVLNWSERLAVLIGVCKAVQFLHTGVIPGFFHNRLKTNNILLNQHRMAKLGDYGLSIISEETNNDTAKGEDPYTSWQMTRLEDDVYSFGLILIETMLGSSIAAKMEATLRDDLASLSKKEGRARLMNPVVSATGSQESISTVISIANKCICPELWSRPSFVQNYGAAHLLRTSFGICSMQPNYKQVQTLNQDSALYSSLLFEIKKTKFVLVLLFRRL
ncbi:hypothetical protein GQ457_08G037410 [Hibiscus cannabinus]